jgi:hypothetical protein
VPIYQPGGRQTIRSVSSSRCRSTRRAQAQAGKLFDASCKAADKPDVSTRPNDQGDCVERDGRSTGKARSDHGGARRDRTDDLMLAKHALSQLSYGPIGSRANVILASSAGDRIRDLGYRAVGRDARSGFGSVEIVRSIGAQEVSRARRARKAKSRGGGCPGKPRSRT